MTNKKSTETHAETHACDLISRRAAIDAIDAIMDEVEPFAIVEPGTTCVIGTGVNNNDVVRVLEQLPSAQPERKVGKWTEDNACEFCGFKPWYERDIHTLSYCPNCGADMRGEQYE